MINRLYTEGHEQTISGGWVNGDSNELLRYSVKITAETHRSSQGRNCFMPHKRG
jgi:hypothetical protein